MTADDWGLVVLVGFAVAALVGVLASLRSYSASWKESLFTLTIRLYVPLMFGQRFRSRCPWPAEGAALIVCNHSSPTDPIMVHSASLMKQSGPRMRIVEWLTAREYCEQPGPVGIFCDIARCIPVARSGRDMSAVREAMRRARDGRLIGVFPEGGLNDGKTLRRFQTGVAFLALSGKLPVFPVFIESAPRGSTMVTSFVSLTSTRVHFGPQVDLQPWIAKKRPSADDLQAATDRIQDAVESLDRRSSPRRQSHVR